MEVLTFTKTIYFLKAIVQWLKGGNEVREVLSGHQKVFMVNKLQIVIHLQFSQTNVNAIHITLLELRQQAQEIDKVLTPAKQDTAFPNINLKSYSFSDSFIKHVNMSAIVSVTVTIKTKNLSPLIQACSKRKQFMLLTCRNI
jgi:hypothetical protein